MVSTIAATAAAAGPAGPMTWVSSPASGTSVAALGPSTPIVAVARARYRAVVTASAIATARGSCLDGFAKRVVSGATASQPTKENISVDAALPTDIQPYGANGVQLLIRSAEADPATATTTTTVSRATSTSWIEVPARSPQAARPITISSSAAAMAARASWPPPVRSVT